VLEHRVMDCGNFLFPFPEFRLPRRLGGEFSRGGFVGMSFELNEGAS
jgi:hypothetical protein